MAKSADAFRTISEVADWLGSPAHVLRFWESKFTQVKPVKRAGGRRYYRPADMLLLGGIKKLLHDDGMTIKGVQKVLREHGVKHVSSLSHPLDEDFDEAPFDADVVPDPTPQEAASESAQVLQFQRDEAKAKLAPQPEAAPQVDAPPVEAAPAADTPPAAEEVATSDAPSPTETEAEPEETVATEAAPDLQDALEPTADPTPEAENDPEPEPSVTPDAATLPAFLHRTSPAPAGAEDIADAPSSDTAETPATVEATPESAVAAAEPEPQPAEPEKPRPAIIELPDDPSDDSIDAAPGLLATIAKRKGQSLPIDVLARASAERDRLAAFVARQSTR